MSSTFRGLAEVLGPSNVKANQASRKKGSERLLLGHVLDVVLDESSPYYNSEYGIGSIRFRAIPEDSAKDEASIGSFATPADRSKYQVPLPGEQVIIYPIVAGSRLTYAYGMVMKQSLNVAYSSEPFIATTAFNVDSSILDALVDEAALANRFKDKLQIPYVDYQNSSYGITSLREGDTIFEGRFGSSILFTSTMDKVIVDKRHSGINIGIEELNKAQTTEDGDPIIVMQASKKILTDEPYLIKPSINESDSVVYMTSTQIIPIEVATSKRMDSWNVKVTKMKPFQRAEDFDSARLQSFIDGEYDPNSRYTINLEIAGTVGQGDLGTGILGSGDWQSIAANFISKKEGFTEVGVFDENTFRAGYGSDKIIKDGVLTTVTMGMAVTKEEAILTLAQYSIPKYAEQIAKDLGQTNWDKLNNNQKAAIVSLGYNVGKYFISGREYGRKIRDYISAGDLRKAGETIFTDGPKSGAKSGPLPGLERRRREESELFNTISL